ncbi:hypothetical protein DFH27DRAFT_608613 [Peziza echinospora]|nr:hypothetical protein DFH27DRAFT_608613 [Peziza echinospora]
MSQPGFDPKTFDPIKHLLKAPPRYDPWMRSYVVPPHHITSIHPDAPPDTAPLASGSAGAFPGFGIAAGAFTVYCVVEHFFFKDDHAHGAGHGEEHH